MANIKISDLVAKTNPAATDVLPLESSGLTNKVEASILVSDTPFTLPGATAARSNAERFSGLCKDVKECGACGDGVTDDWAAIMAAQDSIPGGTLFFPRGTYITSKTITLQRGIRLLGDGTFDTIQGASSQIKLQDGANCSIIDTPAVSGGGSTHYLAIENIVIDGNKANQTEYNTGVQFGGAFIGSFIRNVFIRNVKGSGFALGWGGVDLQINHLWIDGCETTGYAFDTNPDLTGEIQSGLLNIDHLYVENVSNKVDGDPRNVPADRGKGIRINRCISVNINEVHVEAVTQGIDAERTQALRIGAYSSAHMGVDSDTESSMVRILDNANKILTIGHMRVTDFSTGFHFVKKASGVSSNYIIDAPVNPDQPFSNSYYATGAGGFGAVMMPQCKIANSGGVQKVGDASPQYWKMFSDTDVETHYGYIKQAGRYTALGSNKSQPDAAEKDFLLIDSVGNAGDKMQLSDPITLGARAGSTSIEVGAIYRSSDASGGGVGPAYQRVAGQNSGQDMIATVMRGSGAPSSNALYIGQIYVDTSAAPRVAYIAVKINTGANDWRQITN